MMEIRSIVSIDVWCRATSKSRRRVNGADTRRHIAPPPDDDRPINRKDLDLPTLPPRSVHPDEVPPVQSVSSGAQHASNTLPVSSITWKAQTKRRPLCHSEPHCVASKIASGYDGVGGVPKKEAVDVDVGLCVKRRLVGFRPSFSVLMSWTLSMTGPLPCL